MTVEELQVQLALGTLSTDQKFHLLGRGGYPMSFDDKVEALSKVDPGIVDILRNDSDVGWYAQLVGCFAARAIK